MKKRMSDYVKRSEVLALEKEVYVKEVDYRIRCIDASAVESLEGYVLTAETEAEIRKAVRAISKEAKRLTDAILQNLGELMERKGETVRRINDDPSHPFADGVMMKE